MESIKAPGYSLDKIEAEDVGIIEYVSNQEGFDVEYRQLSTGNYRGQVAASLYNKTLIFKEHHSQSVIVSGTVPVDDYLFHVSQGTSAVRRYQGKHPEPLDLIMIKPGTTVNCVFEGNNANSQWKR